MGQIPLVQGVAVLALAWPGSCWQHLQDAHERAQERAGRDVTGDQDDDDVDEAPDVGDEPDCGAPQCDCDDDADEPSLPAVCEGYEAIGSRPNRGATFGATFDPQVPGRVYLSAPGGLYVSDDEGGLFRLTAEVPSGFRTAYPSGKPDTVFATTAGNGAHRSDDGGDSWTPVGLSGLWLTAFAVNPTAEQRMVTAIEGAGIARTADGGKQWYAYTRGMPDGYPKDLVPRFDQPEELLASFVLGGTLAQDPQARRAIVRSENGGQDWSIVHTQFEFIHGVARCPADPDVVYSNRGTNLTRSLDGGRTWQDLAIPNVTMALQHIEIRGDACERIFVTPYDRGIVRSLDGGTTWEGPFYAGIDQTLIVPTELAANRDGSVLIISSYAGAFRSTDAGMSWTPIAHAGEPRLTRLAAGGPGRDVLLLQTYGVGLWEMRPGGDWTQNLAFTEPRGATIEVSPHDPDHFIGGHLHSFDGGASFQRLFPDRVVDAAFDPQDPSDVLIASTTHGVFRSTDGGATYAPINGDLLSQVGVPAGQLMVRAVARFGGRIYAGTPRHGLWVSDDDGAHWRAENPVLSGHTIKDLETTEQALVATVSGTGIHVLDGGGWRVHNGGLTSLNVGTLVQDEQTGTFYLSSEGQLYRSDLTGPWTPLTDDGCNPGVGGMVTLAHSAEGKQLIALGRGGTLTYPLD